MKDKKNIFWAYLLEVVGITSITVLGIKAIREMDAFDQRGTAEKEEGK